MQNQLNKIKRSQNGFTLIEILVAIAILAIIIGPLTMSISQVISVNASSVSREMVIKQVENAVQYISRDTQQAQNITPTGTSFPLNLTWETFGRDIYSITYSINGAALKRSETIDGLLAGQTKIADYIDNGTSTCYWSSGVLTLTVTAKTQGYKPAIETRTVKIGARSAH